MTAQPRLFTDTWPWVPEPSRTPGQPTCYRCHGPALPDPYDPLVVWCSGCGSVEPRMDPEHEATLRAEVRKPQSGRHQRGPSHGSVRL
jgi:hypothetical protein